MKFYRFNTKEKEKSRQATERLAEKKLAKRTGSRLDSRVPLPDNTFLEGYNFERMIGRGSFSLVYRAVEVSTGNEVVIKEYFPKHFAIRKKNNNIAPLDDKRHFTFSEGFKHFFNEALLLKKISHPHVLKTNNMFRANKTAYLVSLNIGGRDLKWFLGSVSEPMNQALLFKVFMPILSTLNFMHGAKILHLDIKPANILLQPNSESLLLDFGAAQRMSSSKRINNLQTLTHGFAPPEQYDKKKSLGPWTDIYAVAASLYYAIACRPPAKSKANDTESRLDLKKYSGQYEPHLLMAINRCLTYDPSTRFDNVDEFAAALLEGSKWENLRDYEMDVMEYDRSLEATRESQLDLAQAVA